MQSRKTRFALIGLICASLLTYALVVAAFVTRTPVVLVPLPAMMGVAGFVLLFSVHSSSDSSADQI